MKTILVPTDFSASAMNAANYAAAFAKEIEGRILLLHTYHIPMFAKDKVGVITDPDIYQKENENKLKTEAKRLVEKYGIAVSHRIKANFLVDEILEAEKEASLVVMGLHGTGYQGQVDPGSMVTATVAKTTKPLIVVPEKAKYTRPEKIIFACDFNPSTDVNVLNALKEVVRKFNSTVYIVNVTRAHELVESNELIHKQVEKKFTNIQHIYAFPKNKHKAEALNEFVKSHQADMIAMIPHQYNLLDSLFHDSFTKQMTFYTHVPLLALPENFSALPGYIL